MDPSIPDKDRRHAAWTMAGDLLDISREMQSGESEAERERRYSEGDRKRAKILDRECADMRLAMAHLDDVEKNGPRERMSADQLAAIPAQAAELRARLVQICP